MRKLYGVLDVLRLREHQYQYTQSTEQFRDTKLCIEQLGSEVASMGEHPCSQASQVPKWRSPVERPRRGRCISQRQSFMGWDCVPIYTKCTQFIFSAEPTRITSSSLIDDGDILRSRGLGSVYPSTRIFFCLSSKNLSPWNSGLPRASQYKVGWSLLMWISMYVSVIL